MANFQQDPLDLQTSDVKYYLGKISGAENIGDRTAQGEILNYFNSEDIGVLQSSVILQPFNESEFKRPSTQDNTSWINFLNPSNPSDTTKSVTYTVGPFSRTVTWTIGTTNRQTEENYATKVLSHFDDVIVGTAIFGQVFLTKIRADLTLASPSFASTILSPDDLRDSLNDIKSQDSYISQSAGENTYFYRQLEKKNLFDSLNSIYSSSYDGAQDIIYNKGFIDFESFYITFNDFKNIVNTNIAPIFEDGVKYLNQLQSSTPYTNIMSGVIGNYQDVSGLNLTGIEGYPTGYVDGKYLRSTTTGVEYVDITDPVLAFTGLTDTPSTITPNEYLRGSADGQSLIYSGVSFLEDVIDRPVTPQSGYLQLTPAGNLVWAAGTTSGDITYNFTGSEFFTGLKDTPSNYDQFKFLRSALNGIEYVDINGGVVAFTGLDGSPSFFTADKYLKVNSAGNSLEYADIPSPILTFTGLTDTPSSFTNASGQYLRINSAENAVEFVDISGEINSQEINWSTYLRYGDLPSASDNAGMFTYVMIDSRSGAYVSNGADWVKIDSDAEEGATAFTGLSDTPNSYDPGKYLQSSTTGLEWVSITSPTVAFTGLTDTPSSYSSQSGKYLVVSNDETGVEFKDLTFYTGAFVGFGGAIVFKGLDTSPPSVGWNDRDITNLVGASGIKNTYLDNHHVVLPKGKYLINAEGGVNCDSASSANPAPATKIGIEFTSGDYAGQTFDSFSNRGPAAGSYGQIRGSVKVVVESENPIKFKVKSHLPSAIVTPSEYSFSAAQTDVSILDLGASKDFLSFTGLLDVPSNFNGASGKFLQVSDDETELEYSSLSGQISSQEINWNVYPTPSDLPDANVHHGMFAHVHSEDAAYMAHAGQWEKIYPQSFTGLSDTPSSLTADKYLKVNSAGDGFVFADAGGGGGGGGGGSASGFAQYSGIDKGSFAHKLPEYIYLIDSNGDVNTIGRLYASYNSADGDRFCYQTNAGGSKWICFNKDTDGTLQSQALYGASNIAANKVSLKTYIDQGRIHYDGGGGSSSCSGILNYQGEYVEGTSYKANDFVTYNGKSYITTSDNDGSYNPEGAYLVTADVTASNTKPWIPISYDPYGNASLFDNGNPFFSNAQADVNLDGPASSVAGQITGLIYPTGTGLYIGLRSEFAGKFINFDNIKIHRGTSHVLYNWDGTTTAGWNAYQSPRCNISVDNDTLRVSSNSTASIFVGRVLDFASELNGNPWSLLAGEIAVNNCNAGGGGGGGGASVVQSTYVGDGATSGIYIPLDFTPVEVQIHSAGSATDGGPYYGKTTLLLSNSGQQSIYTYGNPSSNARGRNHIGTISGQGFVAKGHINDSAFNVNGCTYHYVAIGSGAGGGGGGGGGGSSSVSGGVNSNPAISALSNFTGILPDSILLQNTNNPVWYTTFDFYGIETGPAATSQIQYRSTYDDINNFITFDNDSSGKLATKGSAYNWISGQPNCLQDMIDDGLAIFAGGGSSSSAGGGGGGGGGSSSSNILAWGVFSGTEGAGNNQALTLQGGYNVSGVTRIQDGRFKVTLDNELDSKFYSVSATCNPLGYNGAYAGVEDSANVAINEFPPTTSGFVLDVRTAGNAYTNSNRISFSVMGSGAGGGSSSSAGGGGGGECSGGAFSNQDIKGAFSGDFTLPDALVVPITRNTTNQLRVFHLNGLYDGTISNPTNIQYEWIIGGEERYAINFDNDSSGTFDSHTNQQGSTTTSVQWSEIQSVINDEPTLKEFIDDNKAIYYGGCGSSSAGGGGGGGASSSGGVGSLDVIKNDLENFAHVVPDAIVVHEAQDRWSVVALTTIDSAGDGSEFYQGYDIFYRNGNSTPFVGFMDTTDGDPAGGIEINGVHTSETSWKLKDYIDNDRAIYYGGSSSAGGGGGGGSSDFTGLSDTPNSYDSGKYLQSSATGLDWVDAPAGGGGSSTFTGLTDTSNTFAGASGKYLRVNDDEDTVYFDELNLAGSDLDFTVDSTNIQFIEKKLSTNINSDQTISDFTFPNLITGRTYRVSATLSFYSESETNLVQAEIYNGSTKLITLSNKGRSTTASASMLFIATDDSVTVEGKNLSTIDYILGDPTISVIQLELPPSAIVSVDSDPINPGNPPAGGLFTIGDINLHGSIIDFQDNDNTGLNSIPFSTSFGDIKISANIQNTGDQNSFEDIDPTLPSFGVMSIGDIKVNTFIQNTGDQVSQIATPPFEPQHNALYSWSGTT